MLILVLMLPFVGSCFAALLRANARNAAALLSGMITLVNLVILIASYPRTINRGVTRYAVEWVPTLNLEFSLRMDGFAWTFAMLVSGVGFLVVLYAR